MSQPEPSPGRRVLDSVGLADLKAEHAMQYNLLAEAERLLAAEETASAHQVLRQLLQYSEAHFGSEEVLMRLHSYPGYHQHLREHGELISALERLLEDSTTSASPTPEAIRRWLTTHIHHTDQLFLEFMQKAGS
jgi:hemerythrin